MSYDLLKSGASVNFNTRVAIFPTAFSGVEVLAGDVSAEIAQTIDDVRALHLQIKPYINGLPDLYTDYSYAIVKMPNGSKMVLGLPWIIENSITVSGKKNYQIIVDAIEPEQVEIIRTSLTNRGIVIRSFTETL